MMGISWQSRGDTHGRLREMKDRMQKAGPGVILRLGSSAEEGLNCCLISAGAVEAELYTHMQPDHDTTHGPLQTLPALLISAVRSVDFPVYAQTANAMVHKLLWL